jgi:hypothetical protein
MSTKRDIPQPGSEIELDDASFRRVFAAVLRTASIAGAAQDLAASDRGEKERPRRRVTR